MLYIKKIVTFLLALTVVFACTSCKKDDDGNYTQSGELVILEDTTDINLGIYGIDTLNPIATKSESVNDIMNIIYEPLFSFDEQRNLQPILADSYSLSADGMSVTVQLKENVKWHDGTNFTADDVVYTLSKMNSRNGFYTKIASKISSFTAISRNSVQINLEKPEPDFAYYLTFPIMSAHTAFATNDSFVPMGTGSYKFASRNSTEIVLEPNVSWHGGEASQKKIVVKILKDKGTASTSFNVGEIDAVTSNEINLEEVTPKSNSQIKTIVSDNMVFLGFNTALEKLSSANIRRAVNYILDKQKIVDQYAYGHGVVSNLAINPYSWAYQGLTEMPVSSEVAEELIAGEGYELSDGVFTKNGYPLSVSILVNADNDVRCSIADSICEMLNTSGFLCRVEKVSYSDYIARITNDNFEIFIGEAVVAQNLNPASLLYGDNYFNFDSNNLVLTASSLLGVTDKETYKAVIGTFLNEFNNNPPYIPLYFRTKSVIYGSYVSGIETPTTFDAYKDVEKWYFYDKEGKDSTADGE